MKVARAPEPAPIAKLSQHRRDAEIEAWICERLKVRDLFDGVTTTAVRRDRLKLVLLERGLTDSNAGRFQGKAITWRELVKQLYGEDIA
jgi:hypothetical protein